MWTLVYKPSNHPHLSTSSWNVYHTPNGIQPLFPVKIISFGAPISGRFHGGFNGGQSVFIRILIYKLVIPFSVRELYNVIYIYTYPFMYKASHETAWMTIPASWRAAVEHGHTTNTTDLFGVNQQTYQWPLGVASPAPTPLSLMKNHPTSPMLSRKPAFKLRLACLVLCNLSEWQHGFVFCGWSHKPTGISG